MTTTTLLPESRQRYFNNDGTPCAGGKLWTYAAGTTNPKATFSDPLGLVPNANPVPLDAKGEAVIFWSGAYKVDLKQADGQQVTGYPVDNINTDPAGLWNLLTTLAAGAGAALLGFVQAGAGAVVRTIQERLREIFSAKDYGLKGDGVTDDRAALAAMLATLGAAYASYQVRFPNGEYFIASDITIPEAAVLKFAAGAKLSIPAGVTVTLGNVELKAGLHQIFKTAGTGKLAGTIRNPLIFPEWWGAKADGIHPPVGADFSDRAAAAARNSGPLQAALDFAGNRYAANGLTGTVQLTWGFYVYDATLKVPLSVNVLGYGIGSALFYYAATGNALECVSTNNHLLADFFLAPIAGPTWNYTTGYGLYMNGVSTPVVRNVWSSSFGGGTFYFQSVIEGRMEGLISDNSNGPSFVIRGVGQGSVFYNCVTAGTDGGACFDIQSGYDWVLHGCTAKDGGTGTNGFYLNAVENVNLVSCVGYSINREAFLLTSSTLNCTLTNCVANDAGTLASGVYDAFSIAGQRNQIIAPKVTANTPKYRYGISLGGGATDCVVRDANVTAGTLGQIQDAQPTGSNVYNVRKVSTTDATPTNIWTKALNNSAGAVIEATVVAKQRSAAGESANFKVWARAVTGTGGTTLTAPVVIYSGKSNVASTINATLVLADATANAGVVALQITGLVSGLAIDWEAVVHVSSVTG